MTKPTIRSAVVDAIRQYPGIHVRGLAVCSRYVGEAAKSGELGDGGFTTGDYGRLLADGRLVLVGRVSSFINVAGRPDTIPCQQTESPQVPQGENSLG